jgi:O-antigen/teichoic acid export membrane protein
MENPATVKNKTLSNVLWLGLRYGGSQLVRFTLGVIIARILLPENYTVVAIIAVFTGLATKFITHCLSTALIQQKDVDDADCSSVIWMGMIAAAMLYTLLFFVAPWIAGFYALPEITMGIRVMSLSLFFSAISTVFHARLARQMKFKKLTIASLIAQWASAGLGLALAYYGFGMWALVWQQLSFEILACVAQYFMSRWLPKLRLDFSRLKRLFQYGWKILAANLLSTVYNDLTSLVLGKVFPGDALAYYNKGRQMPSIVSENLNDAVIAALFPVFAKHQDDLARERDLVRKTLRVNAFVVFPLMAGFALVAEPLIGLLLTDKWLPAAPYMLPAAILWALYPLDCTLMQAICAVGRSGLHLILEIIRRVFGLIALCIAAFVFKTPMAIAWSVTIYGLFSMLQAMVVAKPFFNYPLRDQLADILPPLLLCAAMALAVWPISLIALPRLALLLVQIVVGIIVYVGLAALLRLEVFRYVIAMLKEFFKKLKQREAKA